MLGKLRTNVTDINEQLTVDRTETLNSFRNIINFRNYAMGRQDVTLTMDQQRMMEGVLGHEYCDNVCGQILSEHADRLELKGILCKDDSTQTWINMFWQKSKFDDLQQRTHRNTIRDGNFCLMVEYNYEKEKIIIHREKWWDGFTGVFIGYDAYGEMLYAVKEWDSPIGKRRTVYYEGGIERYLANGLGNWLPFVVADDIASGYTTAGTQAGVQPAGTEPVAIPYVDEDGQPLSIPFIHFSNPSDEFENYGASILDGGGLGSQDQINDTQYDISAAARMTGYQRTWSKGYKLQTINGKRVRPKTGPGTHYHADEEEAAWGTIEPGDPTQLLAVYKLKVESFCRSTGTPYNAISGNWPSGESVYMLEQPIRGRTKARQKRFKPAWVEVMHRCIELENTFGEGGLDEDAMLTADYADAGDRDPLALAMADLSFWQGADAAVAAGLPLATYLRVVAGWDEELLQDLENDVAKQLSQNLSDLKDQQNVINPTPSASRGKTKTGPTNVNGNKASTTANKKKPYSKAV